MVHTNIYKNTLANTYMNVQTSIYIYIYIYISHTQDLQIAVHYIFILHILFMLIRTVSVSYRTTTSMGWRLIEFG